MFAIPHGHLYIIHSNLFKVTKTCRISAKHPMIRKLKKKKKSFNILFLRCLGKNQLKTFQKHRVLHVKSVRLCFFNCDWIITGKGHNCVFTSNKYLVTCYLTMVNNVDSAPLISSSKTGIVKVIFFVDWEWQSSL